MQHYMYEWTTAVRDKRPFKYYKTDRFIREWSNTSLLGQHGWIWPAPSVHDLDLYSFSQPWRREKAFAPLAGALRNETEFLLLRNYQKRKRRAHVLYVTPPHNATIQLYQQSFQDAWNAGHSLIIGSEEFDHMVQDYPQAPYQADQILKGLLSILPTTTSSSSHPVQQQQQALTVVISYRYPRIQHLVSIWHEFGEFRRLRKVPEDKRHLSAFITEQLDQYGHMLNPLGLAAHTASLGLSTVVIDQTGLEQDGYVDSSVSVACQVLKVPCEQRRESSLNNQNTTTTTTIEGLKESFQRQNDYSKQSNQAYVDLNEEILSDLDNMLWEWDCHIYRTQLQKYQNDKTLRFLHAQQLLFASCPSTSALHLSSPQSFFQAVIERVKQR